MKPQAIIAACAGSSPRVRGTGERGLSSDHWRRFIPACAGNRPCARRTACKGPVHPRVCGEQSRVSCVPPTNSGSSPRVRGTAKRRLPDSPEPRFIPACAGNRQNPILRCLESAVHPRVCGEQRLPFQMHPQLIGSSPRVRGTVTQYQVQGRRRRFIPACAGNSCPWLPMPPSNPVHPRVCGEQMLIQYRRLDGTGSSPRVRGTVAIQAAGGIALRFIPACAGNSRDGLWRAVLWAVHPRVCGEQCEERRNQIRLVGSSPRVRGTVGLLDLVAIPVRFIPACAGNSAAQS